MSGSGWLMYLKYFNEFKNVADIKQYQEKSLQLGCPEDPYCQQRGQEASAVKGRVDGVGEHFLC